MTRKIAILVSLLLIGGCAGAPIRTHEEFTGYFSKENEKTITVMPIDIKFYQLSAGGVAEQMDEWDKQSDELFRQALMDRLDPLSEMKITMLDESGLGADQKEFLNAQNGLYRAVAQSIIGHTYTPAANFPKKLEHFDYSLGPEIDKINEFAPGDALLFLSGSRTYWTGGRMLLAGFGMLIGAAAGVAVTPAKVPDWVAAALVDSKTGNLVWFRFVGGEATNIGDLRDRDYVSEITEYLFRDLVKQ